MFRSLDARISDSDSHYFSLIQPPRSLLIQAQSHDLLTQPSSLFLQPNLDETPRGGVSPSPERSPPDDPVYSTIGRNDMIIYKISDKKFTLKIGNHFSFNISIDHYVYIAFTLL